MEAAEIRNQNFQHLFAQFKMEHADLPERGMLKLFAEHLDMSSAYLSHLKTARKPIGTTTARNIEEKLKLPRGYMDTIQTSRPMSASAEEKAFIQSCLTMYRQNPLKAQSVILNEINALLREKSLGKSKL